MAVVRHFHLHAGSRARATLSASNFNKKIYAKIETGRNRRNPYLYLDGLVMKANLGGEVATSRCWWPAPTAPKVFESRSHKEDKSG